MERHAPHNAPMVVKMKSMISTVPCPLESHHSLIAPARHPAAKPVETPKRHPNTKPITMPTYKCLRLSGILAASATLFHASAITSPTSSKNALIWAFMGAFSIPFHLLRTRAVVSFRTLRPTIPCRRTRY